MPYEIDLGDKLPIGFCTKSTRAEAKRVPVIAEQFLSTEDGDLFVDRVEKATADFLSRVGAPDSIRPSSIDHMLGLLAPGGKGKLFVNELSLLCQLQGKKNFAGGDGVFVDDIADIRRLRLQRDGEQVTIPNDHAVVFVFSVGWRKGLYFDYTPLPPCNTRRTKDLGIEFGQMYAYLLFQGRFKITEAEYLRFFEQRWFPFISLKNATIQKMITQVRNDWPLDDILEEIFPQALERTESQRERWMHHAAFQPHIVLLQTALERFRAGDYVSANSILWPRIEGILRTHKLLVNPKQKITQRTLLDSALLTNPNIRHVNSLLLPRRFAEYLEKTFFESFDPESPGTLSRNTVSHGVAPAAHFDKKMATIALLIVDHLLYCLADRSPEEPTAST